ncbi:ATP synthase protein I [Pricia antarctica]|uniref:ATP synthase protein I n=1 Tax=Pricia antarctica TaxID=641691 RepID=A0A1G7D0T4_9FLAO|nr:AtpZ/AtpI family protein [Pricia antarctica]SDE45131.1 ATP synthase protein I [Pricia antarctica]
MEPKNKKKESEFLKEVGNKERQMVRAQKEEKRSVWAGLGTFGMVGWSVAVPTVLGTVLGLWLDGQFPQSFSWTLTLLVAGLFMGCAIAWQWVAKENKAMHEHKEDNNE